MKWFKHYSNASQSVKLNKLIDEYGYKGYGWYWALLELFSEHYDGIDERLEIHLNNIKQRLNIYHGKIALNFLQSLHNLTLISVEIKANVCFIKAPILRELQSKDYKYEKNKRKHDEQVNDPKIKNKNKIKNKIKIKKEEGEKKPNGLSPDVVFDLWNDTVTSKNSGLSKAKALSERRKAAIRGCIREYKEMQSFDDWKAYFEKINTNAFLTGHNDRGWKADFDWVIKKSNLIKIAEGRYDVLGKTSFDKINDVINQNPYRSNQ